MNRSERVLKYIKDFGSITPLEAFRDLGYTRLSAAIFDIRKDGHRIRRTMKTGRNRYGQSVSYASYSLAGDGDEV